MQCWHQSRLVAVAIAAIVFTVCASSAAAADQVSGLITRTYVLVEDTDLTGDVTCDVGSNACFSFGAPDIELRLNGFTITGKADAATGCGGPGNLPGEFGITTSARNNVSVRGPGLVQRFRNHGVLVIGSLNAKVDGITVSTNCASGILVAGNSFGTLVQGNVAVRNGSSTPGAPCGGIWIVGHNSRVRLNDAHGNGYTQPADDFGIGVVGTGTGNVIEENTVTANTTGIFVAAGARSTLIRNNTVVGNPGIQAGSGIPEAVDIRNLAPAGETTFERNVCITASNAPCTVATGGRPRPQ